MDALKESDQGELLIYVPREIKIESVSGNTTDLFGYQREYSPDTPGGPGTPRLSTNTSAPNSQNFTTLTVRIEYELKDPHTGLHHVHPEPQLAPYRHHHAYTINYPMSASTRTWLPCVDNMWERCTWEMEFVIPARLTLTDDNQSQDSDEEEETIDDERDLMVVCSGDLVEQTVHPDDTSKKVFIYALAVPMPAQFVSFAVGPFMMTRLSRNHDSMQQYALTEDADLEESGAEILAFFLPERKQDIEYTCSFMQQAMDIYVKEFGSYPFSIYRLTFVDNSAAPLMSSACMSICSSDLLCAPDIIDQLYDTARTISGALATQWSGINIIPKTWPDIWLTIGLANYMSSVFIKHFYGQNEYKCRLKKDIERVVDIDCNRPPLYNPNAFLPLDFEDLEFINLKAPLVLHSLDKRLTKSGISLGLSRAIPKLFLSAITGELNNNAISTHSFLRMCRKISGTDLKFFADQWIYGSGCPKFVMTHNFNRKKMMVEIKMTQETTNGPALDAPPAADSREEHLPTYLFTGPMTVRIHEADGTPYEHIIDIQEVSKQFEVQFNTKYKRIRRNTKRFQARQAAAQAAAEEDGDAMDMLEFGYEMHILEDDQEREAWKIAEWTEEDEQRLSSAAYEWLRLDADFEWICKLVYEQPDFMWVSQLTKERDVLGQYEAVVALARQPSAITSSVLTRVLLNPHYYYRVRMEAAISMAACATEKLVWIGLYHLLKSFARLYCLEDPSSTNVQRLEEISCIPRSNNFEDVAEYYVQMGIAAAISRVRDSRGIGHSIAKQFLLDLLRYNENSVNPYSDCYYIAHLMTCLSSILIPTLPSTEFNLTEDIKAGQFVQDACAELDRYQTLDRLLSSFHNVITVVALTCKMRLMVANLIATELKPFLVYSREGNYELVRLTAFDCLVIMRGIQHPKIAQYLIQVAKSDPSPRVSFHVARGIYYSLGLVMSSLEVAYSRVDEIIIEENGINLNGNKKGSKSGESDFLDLLQMLRKDFQDKPWLQDMIADAIVDSRLEFRVRREFFSICELLYKPAEGTLPKLVIKMPIRSSGPSDREEAPASGKIRLSLGSQRIGSIAAPKPEPRFDTIVVEPVQTFDTIEIAPTKKTKSKKEKQAVSVVPAVTPPIASVNVDGTGMDVSTTVQSTGHSGYHPTRNKRIQKKLYEHPDMLVFTRPVDPIADGCPTYLDEIKEPMDLGTIGTKLSRGMYSNDDQFIRDVKLVVANCHQFNPSGSWLYNLATELDKMFEGEWIEEEAKEDKRLRSDEIRRCTTFLKKLQADQKWYIFHDPVDVVAFPHYPTIIENPIDFKTIREKLDKNKYAMGKSHVALLDEFEADFRLLLSNCFTFNSQPDSYGHVVGKELETLFNKAIKDLRAQSRKASNAGGASVKGNSSKRREEDGNQNAQSIKKIKLT